MEVTLSSTFAWVPGIEFRFTRGVVYPLHHLASPIILWCVCVLNHLHLIAKRVIEGKSGHILKFGNSNLFLRRPHQFLVFLVKHKGTRPVPCAYNLTDFICCQFLFLYVSASVGSEILLSVAQKFYLEENSRNKRKNIFT